MRDYKRALTKLIQHLRANPPSTGIIVGYTLGQSRRALKLGVHERLVGELTHYLEGRSTYHAVCPFDLARYLPRNFPV